MPMCRKFMGAPAGIVASGLVLRLDAGDAVSYPAPKNGLTWFDISGNANNGTLVNGVAYSSANSGVMVFDGVNDYVNLGNKFNPALASQTISIYFKCSNVTTTQFLFSKGNLNSLAFGYSAFIENGFLNCRINGSGTTTQRADNRFNISINTGYILTMIIDRGNNILSSYLNNVLSTETAFGTNITGFGSITNVNNFYIAASATPANYIGAQLNEPLIYNRALTADERTQNYESQRTKYGI